SLQLMVLLPLIILRARVTASPLELLAPLTWIPGPLRPWTPESVTATKLPRIWLLSPVALMLALMPKTTLWAEAAVPPMVLLLEPENQTPTPRAGPLVAAAL